MAAFIGGYQMTDSETESEIDNDDDVWKPRGLPFSEYGTTRRRGATFESGLPSSREPSFGYLSHEIAFRFRRRKYYSN